MSSLNFGQAIEAVKAGKKISRAGWNGSGMFAYLVPANSYPAQTGAAKSHFGESAMVPYREYLALKTAQGDVATWAPSCSDALAEDWEVVIQDKGLTAPRITPADIEANIIDVVYFTAAQASNAEPSNDPLLSAQCLASDF